LFRWKILSSCIFSENGRPVLSVEVEALGKDLWEVNNPPDVAMIEPMMREKTLY